MSILGIVVSGATTALQMGATVGLSAAKGNEFGNTQRWKFGAICGAGAIGLRALWNFREGASTKRVVQETFLDTAGIGLTLLLGCGRYALVSSALIAGLCEAVRQRGLNEASLKTTVLSLFMTVAMTFGVARFAYFLSLLKNEEMVRNSLPRRIDPDIQVLPREGLASRAARSDPPRLLGAASQGGDVVAPYQRRRPEGVLEARIDLETLPPDALTDPERMLRALAFADTSKQAVMKRTPIPEGVFDRYCTDLSKVWDAVEDDADCRRLAMNPDRCDGFYTHSGARGLIAFIQRRAQLFVGKGWTADRAFPMQTVIEPNASAEMAHQRLIDILEDKLRRPVFLADDAYLGSAPLPAPEFVTKSVSQHHWRGRIEQLLLLPPRRG